MIRGTDKYNYAKKIVEDMVQEAKEAVVNFEIPLTEKTGLMQSTPFRLR